MSFLTEEFDPEVEAILDQMAAEDLGEVTPQEVEEHVREFIDWD